MVKGKEERWRSGEGRTMEVILEGVSDGRKWTLKRKATINIRNFV